MIELPLELVARPEIRRALGCGDWATVLRAVCAGTRASQTNIAAATGLSQPYISRLMSGRRVEPGIRTVRKLCDGLGIPRSLAGLLDRDQEVETNRRQLLGGALGISGLAVISAAEGSVPVRYADDDRLMAVPSVTYRRLERRLSSRWLVAPVTAHLALIRRLAAHGSPGRRLHLLLSETAGLAAWLYLDLEDRANARNHYQLAVRAAERSGHPLLPAYMQASYGHFIASCGDARQGLRQIGHARERLPRSAPPVAAVWLDAIAATALAACGDRRALTVLGRAEEQIGGVTDDEPMWPWLFRFDEPKLAGYQAKAYLGLRQWQAADRAYAVASSASSAPKQRAVMDVERSQAIAGLGEIDRACTLAVTALNTGRAFGSERVVRAVADFRAALGARAGSAVDALDERLHAIYQEDW